MHAANPLLLTVILLSAGVLGLAIARFAKISPIIGFFVIGAVIGPQVLGFVDNHSPTLHFLGELGVCFLLFDVGLHISLKELRTGWKNFFFPGALQFICVTTLLSLGAKALGLAWCQAIVMAAIFSLSSTALVLKILSDEQEESSPVGKRATEVLVLQDIIAILLLVILTGDLAKGVTVSTILEPLGKLIVAAVAVVIFGRIALKPLFRLLIALKSDEVITAFALLLVFVTSWATQSLGLSLALGAFLGGLALSESSYSYLVRGEVAPFRSLLLSLFFLSVGIGLNLGVMYQAAPLLAVLLGLFVALKIFGNIVAFRIAKIEKGVSTLLGFLLAQGSEFAFVLLAVASTTQLIDQSIFDLTVSLVGLSLAITPILAGIGCYFSRSVCRVHHEQEVTSNDPQEVIIVRIDEYGRRLAAFLDAERIPYRAHDNDLERLAYAKSRGLNVYYSDLNRPRTLGRVSLGKVLAVVSLVEDEQILQPLIAGLKKIDGNVPLVAATENPSRLEYINSLGIEEVFIKNDNSLVALFGALLKLLGFSAEKVELAVDRALKSLEPESLFPQFEVSQPELASAQA